MDQYLTSHAPRQQRGRRLPVSPPTLVCVGGGVLLALLIGLGPLMTDADVDALMATGLALSFDFFALAFVWYLPWKRNRFAPLICPRAQRDEYGRNHIPHFVVAVTFEPSVPLDRSPLGRGREETGVLTLQGNLLVYEGRYVDFRIRRDNIIETMAGHSFAERTWVYGKAVCLQLREEVNGRYRIYLQSREFPTLTRSHVRGSELEKALSIFTNGIPGRPAPPTDAGSALSLRLPSRFSQSYKMKILERAAALCLPAMIGCVVISAMAAALRVANWALLLLLFGIVYMGIGAVLSPWIECCPSEETWCRQAGNGDVELGRAAFVASLALNPSPTTLVEWARRLFINHGDIGLLSVDGDYLCYRGDSIDFRIARTDVARILLRKTPNWAVYGGFVLELREPIAGFTGIMICAKEGYTIFRLWRRRAELRRKLNEWMEAGSDLDTGLATGGARPP